jgi:ribosomal protein L31
MKKTFFKQSLPLGGKANIGCFSAVHPFWTGNTSHRNVVQAAAVAASQSAIMVCADALSLSV